MSDAFDVIHYGTDSSGRPIRMTKRMRAAFEEVQDFMDGQLVIVQGAFNPGTDQSAGTHDLSGCLDIRTWNLTTEERTAAQRKARSIGWAAWYRTAAQGFDPHMHWLLLDDHPLHQSAFDQQVAYRTGRNGLANNGPDDFWRPDPIPSFDYDKWQEESSVDYKRIREIVAKEVAPLERALSNFRQGERNRDELTEAKLDEVIELVENGRKKRLRRADVRAAVKTVLDRREANDS